MPLRILHFFFLITFCLPAHANKVWTLKEVLDYTLEYNPTLSLLGDKEKAYDYQMAAQKAHFQPKGLFSVHGEVEDNQDGLFSEKASRAGVTPSLNWRLPTGTLVSAQVTQFMQRQEKVLNQTQWKVSVEQPLLKGSTRQVNQFGLQDASQAKALAKIAHEHTKSQILYATIQQYALLANAWAQYSIQKAHLAKHLHFKKIVEEKIQMGLMSEVDGMMLEIQSARYQQMLHQTKRHIEQSSFQLSQIMGEPAGQLIHIQNDALELKAPLSEVGVDQVIAYYQQSFEIEKARAKQQERVLRDDYLWDLKFKATLAKGRQHYKVDGQFDYEPDEHVHANTQRYVGLYLSIPLNQKATLSHQLYQNQLSQKILQSEQEVMTVKTANQMQLARQQVDYWEEQLHIAQKSNDLSLKTRDIVEQKYLSGYASGLDWQQAQLQALQAQTEVHMAQTQKYLAQIGYLYQAGMLTQQWTSYV